MARENPRGTRTDMAPIFNTPYVQTIDPDQPIFSADKDSQETQDPPAPPAPPETKDTSPKVYKNEKGNPSGIELNGKTYLGLSPKDVDLMAQADAGKNKYNPNYQPAVEQGFAAQQQQVQQQAQMKQMQIQQAYKMAQQGLLTPEQLQAITGASPDIGQALGGAGIGAGIGIVGGAATGLGAGILAGATGGAIAGTAITPLAGTIAGAALGALGGFLIAMRSSIKSQQTEEFAADQTALTKGQTMLRGLITDTNKNPQNAAENIALFYQTLNMIDAAHAKTWQDSQENLNKFLGNDGTEQLAKFETFDSTLRQYYINRFETALQMPDPTQSMITTEDLEEADYE